MTQKQKNRPAVVVDAVTNIRRVGNSLKNLYHLVNTVDWNPQDLESCLEITEVVLKKQIEAINYDLGHLAGEFEGAEYEPIEL